MFSDITRRRLLDGAAGATLASMLGASSFPAGAAEAAAARRTNFDDGWRFATGNHPDAVRADFVDADWTTIDLPHDWSIAGPYSQDQSSGGSRGDVAAWARC